MNNNQSIDDILRQLKNSVSSEDTADNDAVDDGAVNDYSEEGLKQELKNQYFEAEDDASYVSEEEYSIDNDFLSEAESYAEEPDAEELDVEESEEEEPDAEQSETETDIVFEEETDSPESAEAEALERTAVLIVTDDAESAEAVDADQEFMEVVDSFTEEVEDVSEMFEDEFEDDVQDDVQEDSVTDATVEEQYAPRNALEDSVTETVEVSEYELSDTDDADRVDTPEDIDAPFELIPQQSQDPEFDESFETDDYEQDIVYTSIPLELQQTDAALLSQAESVEADADVADTESVDGENAPQQAESSQKSGTYISLMRNSGVDFSAHDAYKSRTADDTNTATVDDTNTAAAGDGYTEDVEEVFEDAPDSDSDTLDLSTINLMMQLGEREEVAERIGEDNIEEIIEEASESPATASASPVEQGGEYVDRDQDEVIRNSYRKKRLFALLSMCGCLFLAITALIFEALPILEVGLNGIFDYVQYPSFYILMGLQFVIFSAAICIKQLWGGVQSVISAAPNRYFLVFIIVSATVIYDIWTAIAVAVGGDVIPPLFNAMAAAVIAISSVIDFVKISANMHTFNVYSSDANKFTVVDERQKGRIAEKMYAGGLEPNKRIYTAASVDFPRGLFRGIGEKDGQSRSMTLVMVISILISIIATVVSAILGLDMYASLGAFMICMFASMPLCLMCADSIPLASAAVRLAKRGIAIAGKGAVENHSKCDVMVFGDLHMFKKCRTEDVGIAIYDKGVTYLALGCINALYSKIGGPLSGMDTNLPDVFKFQNVDIKRVTRSGIEAVVDKKHVLVVGERSFLQRYGMVFPEDENRSDRCSLCVSVNGGVTAKLSIKYEPEPVFEMLIERMYREGITCAIETYDPLINSDMIARSRTLGSAPVSVVHKNAEDYRASNSGRYRGRFDGVIACSSRLKLAEAEVWLKKLRRVEKKTKIFSACCCGVGVVAAMLTVIFGAVGSLNQYHVLLYLLLQLGVFSEMLFNTIPGRKYFTVEALYDELEQESIKEQKKLEREAARKERREAEARITFEKTQEESNTDE